MNHRKKNSAGFTLIETLVYLALLTVIMGSFLVVVFEIIESNSKNQVKIDVREDGNFLIGKIESSMNGATAIAVQNGGKTLVITNTPQNITLAWGGSGQPLTLQRGSTV